METKDLIHDLEELAAFSENTLEGILDDGDVRLLREAAKRLTELSTYEGRQNVHAA